MSKRIVIDARIINSSTGRYVERLITYLQHVDRENDYIVLVPKKDRAVGGVIFQIDTR